MSSYLLFEDSKHEIDPRTILRYKLESDGMYKFEDWALGLSWIKSYGQSKSTNPLTGCTYGQLVDHLNHSKQNRRSTIGKPTRLICASFGDGVG